MECNNCKNTFKTKSSLNNHIKNARYCLEQRKKTVNFLCELCTKNFSSKYGLCKHKIQCGDMYNEIKKQMEKEYFQKLEQQRQYYEKQIESLQEKLKDIAIQAVSRPTTTKNTQINNYIQKLECITDEHIKDQAQFLTLEHIQKGPEGYAEYALEYPLKNRIVCVDYARRKVKFKDKEGNVITDPEMSSVATKLFQSIKDRNKDLILSYGTELRDRFGEEMETVVKLLEYKSDVDNSADGSKPEFLHDFVRSVCCKTIPE